jgi:hypothetical protein
MSSPRPYSSTVRQRKFKRLWDAELSDREVYLIGKIVILWGALEYEVFSQTLMTFDSKQNAPIALPKAMNNMQFTELLSLWQERVIGPAKSQRAKVLQRVHADILHLKDFRDSIVHGMWEWSAADLQAITSVRIRKREIIRAKFTADGLEDFCLRLAEVNFKLRFPGGTKDLARTKAERGSYMSRRFLSAITGGPNAGEWHSIPAPDSKSKK